MFGVRHRCAHSSPPPQKAGLPSLATNPLPNQPSDPRALRPLSSPSRGGRYPRNAGERPSARRPSVVCLNTDSSPAVSGRDRARPRAQEPEVSWAYRSSPTDRILERGWTGAKYAEAPPIPEREHQLVHTGQPTANTESRPEPVGGGQEAEERGARRPDRIVPPQDEGHARKERRTDEARRHAREDQPCEPGEEEVASLLPTTHVRENPLPTHASGTLY